MRICWCVLACPVCNRCSVLQAVEKTVQWGVATMGRARAEPNALPPLAGEMGCRSSGSGDVESGFSLSFASIPGVLGGVFAECPN